MRNLHHLNENRILPGDSTNGAFNLTLQGCSLPFTVIATSRDGWDHVSVSTEARMPRWEELQQVRQMFFEPNEAVMLLYPPEGAEISSGENSVDLWRPAQGVPLPPQYCG